MLGTWKGIALHKEVLLSHVFWHKYTKHYHFANVKFPGRKHTLHVNSCPDHSREQKTASSVSASPYSLNVPAKTWPKKTPHISNPTAQFLHVHRCLFPTADLFKDFQGSVLSQWALHIYRTGWVPNISCAWAAQWISRAASRRAC